MRSTIGARSLQLAWQGRSYPTALQCWFGPDLHHICALRLTVIVAGLPNQQQTVWVARVWPSQSLCWVSDSRCWLTTSRATVLHTVAAWSGRHRQPLLGSVGSFSAQYGLGCLLRIVHLLDWWDLRLALCQHGRCVFDKPPLWPKDGAACCQYWL